MLIFKKFFPRVASLNSGDGGTPSKDGYTQYLSFADTDLKKNLEGHSVERMYLRQRCSDGSVNKTILKPCLAAAMGCQYVYVGFSRRNKIPRSSAYTISEKAIRFRHPDYGSGSKVNQFVHVPRSVDTQHFIQIHAHVFE